MYCWCRPTEKLNSEQIHTLVQHCCCCCFSEVFQKRSIWLPDTDIQGWRLEIRSARGPLLKMSIFRLPNRWFRLGETLSQPLPNFSPSGRGLHLPSRCFSSHSGVENHQLQFQRHSLVRLCPLLGEAVAAMPHLCVRVDFNSYGWVFPFWNHSLISELEKKIS